MNEISEISERLADKLEAVHKDIADCRLSISDTLGEMRTSFVEVRRDISNLTAHGCSRLEPHAGTVSLLMGLEVRLGKVEIAQIRQSATPNGETNFVKLGKFKLNGTSSILAACLGILVLLIVGIQVGKLSWAEKSVSNVSIGLVPQTTAAVVK